VAAKSSREVGSEVRALLDDPATNDRELLDAFELLAKERTFPEWTVVWGPVLYARNRPMFRSFILRHFSWWKRSRSSWSFIPWKGAHEASLEAWRTRADIDDDVQTFRRLNAWRHAGTRGADARRWAAELVLRFEAAKSPARRAIVLDKYEGGYRLTQTEALALYAEDPSAAAFILRHSPWRNGRFGEGPWIDLQRAARERGDDEFAQTLYRRQVALGDWAQEILALAEQLPDTRALDDALERCHPLGFGLDLGRPLFQLLRKRGRDVMPYVLRHASDVWSGWRRGAFEDLVAHARKEGWLDLWATLIRTCASDREFDREVRSIVDNKTLGDPARRERLAWLAGVSRELNFPGFGLAVVHSLTDGTALALYRRYPELVRGPYKPHVAPTRNADYETLVAHLIAVRDEDLIDRIASRYVTAAWLEHAPTSRQSVIVTLSAYYDGLRDDPAEFSRRAASVLTLVPAHSIWNYRRLLKDNRLARLLFTRADHEYLASPSAIHDLVEGSEIHVQALAYRILAIDDERAQSLSRELLPILQGTLLRPLHRKTRLPAFGALLNAASRQEEATLVLARCREALDLPDLRYPKEELVGLIGRILHRFPALARPTETPLVFRAHRQVAAS